MIFGGYYILKAQGRFDGSQTGMEGGQIATPVTQPQIEVQNQAATDHKQQSSALSKFMNRLPQRYHQAELYSVSSEDHYLRVHTSVGDELILMRLSDALRELESVAGLQTHRSWWVALDAIEAQKRINGKSALLLKTGISVPVSRTYDKAVKEVLNQTN